MDGPLADPQYIGDAFRQDIRSNIFLLFATKREFVINDNQSATSESGPGDSFGQSEMPVFTDGLPGVESGRRSVHAHPFRYLLGFTLLELIIAVAIIGALAAIAIPNYYQHIEKAQMAKVISEMKLLEKEIFAYAIEKNAFPETLADIGRDGFPDPWGNPYRYLNVGTAMGNAHKRKDHNLVPINSDFDLYSMGPDGETKPPLTEKSSYDDIIRASNGAYFGPARTY